MDTDYGAAWRRARFTNEMIANAISEKQRAVMVNFNALANDPKVGAAATSMFGHRLEGVDVAMRYLATTRHGSMNETGMAVTLAGQDTGPTLINQYGESQHPTSPSWRSLGLGDDFVVPWIDVTPDGEKIKVGLPSTPNRPKFRLAVVDVTRIAHANPNITGRP